MIKLARTIFNECPDKPENNRQVLDLLSGIGEQDANNYSEALILKGKVAYRQQEYSSAIANLQAALKIQIDKIETDEETPPRASCYFYLGLS